MGKYKPDHVKTDVVTTSKLCCLSYLKWPVMCKTWVSNLKLDIEAEFAPFRKITSRWVVAELVRNSLENSATQLAPFSSGSRCKFWWLDRPKNYTKQIEMIFELYFWQNKFGEFWLDWDRGHPILSLGIPLGGLHTSN